MTREQLTDAIVEAVRMIQENSGRMCPQVVPETKPVGGLPDFDSLNGLEAVVLLSEKLGITISENVFLNEDGTRSLQVDEIADRLEAVVADRESVHGS